MITIIMQLSRKYWKMNF